jgi:hypothetical protein
VSPKRQLPIYDDRGRLLAYTTQELIARMGLSEHSNAFVRKHLTVYDDRRVLSRALMRRRPVHAWLCAVVGRAAQYLPIVDEAGEYLGVSAAEVGALMHLSESAVLRRLVMSLDGETRVFRSAARLLIYDEHDNLLGDSVDVVAQRLAVCISTLRRYTVTVPGVRRIVYVQRLREQRPLRPIRRAQ